MAEKILKKDEFLFKDGDQDFNLYKVISGKLLHFAIVGSKVIPFENANPGAFVGPHSFFLKKPRISYAVALEDTSLSIITPEELEKDFPNWLKSIAISISKKLEENATLIANHGIKRTNVSTIRPLSIEEQRHYLELLK